MEDIHNNTKTDPESLSFPQILMLSTVCLISITAFGEHLVVLLITCVNKTVRQKPYVLSILLLSSSDIVFSMGMFLYALFNLASLRQTWLCGLICFLLQLGFVSSLGHTLIICTERYLLTRPIPMQDFSVRKRRALILVNTGICSLLIGIPYLFSVREPTVEQCTLVTLFRGNMSYALVPVRSISFLLWMCTVVIYVRTAKNFRNAVRRTDRLVESHLTQNNTYGKVVNKRARNLKDKMEVRHAQKSEDIKFTNSGQTDDAIQSVPQNKIQTVERDANTTGNMQFKAKADGDQYEKKQKEDNIEMDQTKSISFGKNIPRPSPNTSTNTSSCSSSGNVVRQTKPDSNVLAEAFRTVSVVFVVFLISVTPNIVAGLVMTVVPLPKSVEFGCSILLMSTTLTNPFMYAFLMKDFRKILRCK